MKKILVTGAAGFIGFHLSSSLLRLGHQVIGLDNLHTGDQKHIDLLQSQSKNFQFIAADIVDSIKIDSDIDQIYHLACPAAPIHYQDQPIRTIKTNVIGTMHLLDLAVEKKARILFASTSEVYGSALENPQKESYWGNVNPHGIRSCYDEGKRMGETLCMDYHRQLNADIRIIRIFNTYGPNMQINDGRIINNFIIQALENKDITVFGDGEQTRSFCYVDDMVEGIILMMEQDSFLGPVNLGNPHEFSVLFIAQRILSLIETKSKIAFHPLPLDDPPQRKPDITLALEKLNWQPTIRIDEGIPKTIAYFRDLLA